MHPIKTYKLKNMNQAVKRNKKTNPRTSKSKKQLKPKPSMSTTKPRTTSLLFLSLLTFTLRFSLSTASTTYQMDTEFVLSNAELNCDEVDKTVFYAIRLIQYLGKPISFEINTATIAADKQYIADTSSVKRYGYYEYQSGGPCYYHKQTTGKNSNPLFVLVIRNNGGTSEKCKVVGIITNTDLEACGGTSTDDLFSVLQPKTSASGAATTASFQRILRDSNYLFLGYHTQTLYLFSFSVSDIDDRVLEALLLSPVTEATTTNSISLLNYNILNNVNDNLGHNTIGTEINGENVVKNRISIDNLPGYFLGVYTGGADDTTKYTQKIISASTSQTTGIHVELYIAKPEMIAIGETHSIEITSKPFSLSASRTIFSLRNLVYRVEVTRISNQLQFRVKRDGVAIPALNIDKAYGGISIFTYFSFTVGGGYLYFTDATNVRAKYYEMLHFYQAGQTPLRAHSSFEETTSLGSVLPYSAASQASTVQSRWIKVEYKPHAGVTTNKAAFRTHVVTYTRGVYPPFLLTTVVNSYFARCYFNGIRLHECLAMGHLRNKDEAIALHFRHGPNKAYSMSVGIMRDACRVGYSETQCLAVMPGYIFNLEPSLRTRIPNVGKLSVADFNALDEKTKGSVTVFTNSAGTQYMVSCYYSCKFKTRRRVLDGLVLFEMILIVLGLFTYF